MVTTFELRSGYQYRIEASTDGSAWTTVDDHTAAPTTAQANYSLLPKAVDARYLRLTVTGSNFNGGRHLLIIRMMIAQMRIASVDVDLITLPAVTPAFAWRRGLRGSHGPRTTAVLRITTDDGAVGEAYHEWSGAMLADIVDRVLRDELVGERAERREWLWHRLWELDRTEEFPIWLLGVVDVALWDLEGRVLGVPVHRLLGTYRD